MMLVLGVLVIAEALGTTLFIVLYLWRSAWRDTAVGRHLAVYGLTLAAVYLVTLLRFQLRNDATLLAALLGHTLFTFAIWQRVALVLREQRQARRDEELLPPPDPPPDE